MITQLKLAPRVLLVVFTLMLLAPVQASAAISDEKPAIWISYGNLKNETGTMDSIAAGAFANTIWSGDGIKILGGFSLGTDFSGEYFEGTYQEYEAEKRYSLPKDYTWLGDKKTGGMSGFDLLLAASIADSINVYAGGGIYSQKHEILIRSDNNGSLYAVAEPTYVTNWVASYGAQLLLGGGFILGYERHTVRGQHYQLGVITYF